MEIDPALKVRNLLARVGSNLNNIDQSYNGDYRYGDSTGNRTVVSKSLDNADYMIRNRLNLTQPEPTPKMIQQPTFQPQYIPAQPTPVFFQQPEPIQQMTPTREERLNKLLGKQPIIQQPVTPPVSDEHAQLVAAFSDALKPVVVAFSDALKSVIEQLEDIAIINGILVQRIEKLIKVVDPDVSLEEEAAETFQEPTRIEDITPDEPLEVYDPEVSMSVTDLEETPAITQNTQTKEQIKKRKGTTK